MMAKPLRGKLALEIVSIPVTTMKNKQGWHIQYKVPKFSPNKTAAFPLWPECCPSTSRQIPKRSTCLPLVTAHLIAPHCFLSIKTGQHHPPILL